MALEEIANSGSSFLVAVRLDAAGRVRALNDIPVPRRYADLFSREQLETLRAAPKVLLHDHLDGGLRPETIVDLAAEHGYDGLPTTDVDDLAAWFSAFIEIPRGSRTKYELDRSSGHIRLDRVLFSSVHYPADYGFVMDTVGGDGDPLDAVVIVEEPTFPGCVVRARPVGTLFMDDEHGNDEKILAVPVGDPRFDEITRLDDLAAHWRREIETFFATYKELEQGKTAAIKGWRDADVAWRLIRESRARGAKAKR